MLEQTCAQCSRCFEITDDDLNFLEKVSPVFAGKKECIAPPTRCPDCRLQRRLAYRSSTSVFLRPGFPEGKPIFSMYPESMPFPVMPNDIWMSDKWDPMDYGVPYDLARPFFEQFRTFSARVPQPALAAVQNEDCEYCNNLSKNKHCYLVFNTSGAEGCMYCENAWDSRDCIECTMALQSELCYDCIYCIGCYNLQSSDYCESCSDSHYLSHCRSCTDCFGCVNLSHKQYCIWNEQKTKEEYEAFLTSFQATSWKERTATSERFHDFCLRHPRPHATIHQSEDVSGNFLSESRGVQESYFVQHGEDLVRCFNVHEGVKDCRDYSLFGRNAELIYESAACGINIQRLFGCYECREGSSNLLYCWFCDGCESCFGCISLRKKKYCIFNVQYTEEEYNRMAPQIIAQMSRQGEWGEFFSLSLAPLPYNHTCAQRYFPLTKEHALAQHIPWYEKESVSEGHAIDATDLPDTLPATDDTIVARSSTSGRAYRIIPSEIERYRRLGCPLPRLTYDERMEERASLLGGIRLFDRTCAKTGKPMRTTYPPESPWIIWDKEVWEREFHG